MSDQRHFDFPAIQAHERELVDQLTAYSGLGIGIAGAHRTGKTTLAKQIAEKNGIPFVETSVKQIAAEYGFDVNSHSSFEERMDWQEHLLETLDDLWNEQQGMFVTDRTPFCMIGYMLADCPNGEISPEMNVRVQTYINRCIELAERYFVHVTIVQPAIEFEPVEGAPVFNIGYQEKHNAICLGYAINADVDCVAIPRWITELQARAELVADAASASINRAIKDIKSLPMQ